MHGKAAIRTRRQRVSSTLARVFAGWRTRLGDRLADPLLQAHCPPPPAVTVADPR